MKRGVGRLSALKAKMPIDNIEELDSVDNEDDKP